MLLHLVVAVDEGEEVEEAELRLALEHRAERRARRLLQVVEEHHRAVGQALLHEQRRRQWRQRCGGGGGGGGGEALALHEARRGRVRRLGRRGWSGRRRALSDEGLPLCLGRLRLTRVGLGSG